MRIIAGSARSLKLRTPEGLDTRPTSDQIKETLFNILQADIPDCRFLDLFAGSGQIGLEALSRGAREAVFVEHNKKACSCITENIRHTGFEKQARLLSVDVSAAIRTLDGGEAFDLIFMDAPYHEKLTEPVLAQLAASSLVDNRTLIIAEAALDAPVTVSPDWGLTVTRCKQYKTNAHYFLRREIL